MKYLIQILAKIVPYAEEDQVLNDLNECKQAYVEIQEKQLQQEVKEQLKDDLLINVVGAGASEGGHFEVNIPYTTVSFEEAMNKETIWYEYVYLTEQQALVV
ncbi:MAG: hypothetical protein EZS28_055057, partial [Streblomastix strix]